MLTKCAAAEAGFFRLLRYGQSHTLIRSFSGRGDGWLSPLRGFLIFRSGPRLTPWPLFFCRSATGTVISSAIGC